MKALSFLPFLLLLLILFLTSIPLSNSQVPAFNGYILAFQFTKSLCNQPIFRKCDPNWNTDLPKEFTLHGLWDTQWVSKKTPCGKQLLLSEIYTNVTLRDGLYQKWVDAYVVYTPSANKDGQRRAAAEEFWQWEWDQHGQYTCLSTLEYFKTAYDLFTNVGDVYELFKREGLIYPGGYINLTEATTILGRRVGAKPFMRCINNNFNEEFLSETELLFDRATLSIRNHYRDWILTCTKEIVSLRQSGYNDQQDIID
ncbi:hypothetical protein MKX03_032385 [Papaver bracteatum]|nr:hypothetical protein MKX03_032385 [Papaver bracteatum]